LVKLDKYRFNSEGVSRQTPDELYASLNEEFSFTIDVCADKENTKCSQFFTVQDNALAKDWSGNVCWMNPPFGRSLSDFVKKAYAEGIKGTTVVCLLPVRSNTGWWHDYCMKGEIRLIRGRPKFQGYEHGLPWPLAVVIFGPKAENGVVKSLHLTHGAGRFYLSKL